MSDSIETLHVGTFTVRIEYDPDCENPCTEQDGLGFIHSFSHRHVNHIDIGKARIMMESDPDIVPLAYYEHGNCIWMVSEGPHPAGVEFQWDGTRFAGIWVPDDCVRESYQGQDGLSRHDWMVRQAEACCEIYTQWCNGEIYYYIIEDEDGENVDSLGGLYGLEYAIDEARSAAQSEIERRQRETVKIDNMMAL